MILIQLIFLFFMEDEIILSKKIYLCLMWKSEFIFVKQLLFRLGVGLLGMTLIRFVFLAYNYTYFDDLTFLNGIKLFFYALRFDLVSVTYANGLLIIFSLLPLSIRIHKFYQSFLNVLFIVFNSILFFIEIIDIGYYQFASRRTLFSDFFMFSNNQSNILDYFLEYWWLVLLLICMILALFRLRNIVLLDFSKKRWFVQILIFIFGIGLSVISARGGLQKRPLTPIDAAKYTFNPVQNQLITNTTINLIFSFQQRTIQPLHYFSDEDLDEIFTLNHNPTPKQPFQNKNVMFIIMESLSKEYTGFFEHKPYTPFFDSLVQKSFYLENTFANGLRSTEGIAAITAGLPHLMYDPFIFSAYQTNKLDAMAGLLKKKGYQTAFFHGSYKGSMNFDSFAKLEGYDQFIDKSVYNNPKDYDGHWGIWDIPFFEYTAKELSKFKQPFFATIFSLTSHHPYNVEKWFEKKYPNMDRHYRTVLYADLALKRFFDIAKKSDWYKNTIFIITGDHTGPRISKPYQTVLGKYKSPIILFDPSGKINGKHKGLAQHIDIIPTVLDVLHYDLPFHSFGQSMLDTVDTNYAMMRMGIFQICDTQYLLRFDGHKSIFLYDYQNDPLKTTNLLDSLPDVAARLEKQLKARLQCYNKSLIENTLGQ